MSAKEKRITSAARNKRKRTDSVDNLSGSLQKCTVVQQKRSSARRIFARIGVGKEPLRKRAWANAQRETKTAWQNWAEEMANMALHVVCVYAERLWPKVLSGELAAETVFDQARAALNACGSYDGLQPHVQSNDKIFDCALQQLGNWRRTQFGGDYRTFMTHILQLFHNGKLPFDENVKMLRDACRVCTPEPRVYANELRKVEKRLLQGSVKRTRSNTPIAPTKGAASAHESEKAKFANASVHRRVLPQTRTTQSWVSAGSKKNQERLKELVRMEN